ncbi:MAG: 16S rRNA pseudouridine(516) synthase [Oscillospiraceae bacterium]|nr:16S rRNA pseudouridine(516) synthase [Oscillospiraceae bacterium]
MRLDKFLSERTPHTRSIIKKLIAGRKVTVNGEIVLKADMNVAEEDLIKIEGVPVRNTSTLTLLLNKPSGYVSATEDKSEKTVIDLLPEEYRNQNLSPAGRLDKDTTGLLILTNDGDLLHRLTSPKKHVPKYYTAHLARPFTDDAAQQLAEGITLRDGTVCKPAQAAAYSEDKRQVLICIREGKYHQVKRMMAATGNHVEKLRREACGELVIPADLEEGKVTILLDKDLCKLLNSESVFSALFQSLRKSSS